MKIFKNRVGRPSNEIIKKRRNFCIVLIIISICVLGIGVYFAKDRFLNKDVESNNKNIGSGSVSLTATDAKGNTYKSGTWTTKVKLVAGKPSSKGVVFGYTWYKDGKEYSSCKTNTCIINTSQSGTFKVKVRVERKVYYSSSINVKVDANQISSVSISNSVTKLSATIKPSTTVSGYKYQWYKDGVAITGATKSYYEISKKTNKDYENSFGTYKLKITTGAGASKTKAIDICKVTLGGVIGDNLWSNKDVSLTASMKGPIKSFQWYKDNKVYSGCNGKTTCKITTNQKSNYCVKATSNNGQIFSDCKTVKIDKSTPTISLYANGKKISSYGDAATYVKTGVKLTVQISNSYCSKYDTSDIKWRLNSGGKVLSTGQTYTPKTKGSYYAEIYTCNRKLMNMYFRVQ